MKTVKTYWFPGAKVQEIACRTPEIIWDLPKLDHIVVYVGTNQQSELLKLVLIHSLKVPETKKCHTYTSGLIPTLG